MLFTCITILLNFLNPVENDQFIIVFDDSVSYEAGVDRQVVLGMPDEISIEGNAAIKSLQIKVEGENSYLWDSGVNNGNSVILPEDVDGSTILIYLNTESGKNYVFPFRIQEPLKLDI